LALVVKVAAHALRLHVALIPSRGELASALKMAGLQLRNALRSAAREANIHPVLGSALTYPLGEYSIEFLYELRSIAFGLPYLTHCGSSKLMQ
jgi:hypothetical protein